MSNRHAPNSWEGYLNVHERRIRDLTPAFIIEDRLPYEKTETVVLWDGELLCRGGIEIHVRKRQRVFPKAGRDWVVTAEYSYQVLRRNGDCVWELFRYDNAPHHNHPDPHHRHRYNADGEEEVEHVGVDGWPTLGDVLEEAYALWQQEPDAPPCP